MSDAQARAVLVATGHEVRVRHKTAPTESETPFGAPDAVPTCSAGRGHYNSLPPEFGLGTAEQVVRVAIRWPSGVERVLEDVAVDPIVTITEGF